MRIRTIVITLLTAAVCGVSVQAQSIDKILGGEKSRDKLSLPDPFQKSVSTEAQRIATVPMEGPVDPAAYILGPSDLLSIGVWGPVSFLYPTAITPEGSVIIPTVGEVQLAGKTLNEGKKLITSAVRKKYPLGEISVTLQQPRSFIVSLKGAVLMPGQYVATAVDRVEKIFTLGTTVKMATPTVSVQAKLADPAMKQQELSLPKMTQSMDVYDEASTRNILVIHRTGDTTRVDIPKYYATGNTALNPFLLDGDVIVVPRRNIEQHFVSVAGAVNAPGKFEYADGDELSDILRMAQGLTSEASGTAVISRLDAEGRVQSDRDVDAAAVLSGRAPDVPLQPADRILIRTKTNQRGDYRITIAGEVLSPGNYPISLNSTRLSEVIRWAGGFTPNALPTGSVVFRRTDNIESVIGHDYNVLRNIRSARFNLVDSAYYFHGLLIGLEPVNTDFRRLFSDRDTTQDIVLQDGDIIFVASNQHTVLVSGQVATPGHQPYVAGADCEFYIRRAGGYTEYAEEGDTRVIKSGSLTWVEPGDTKIESGDQIFVPKYIPKDFSFYLSIVRDVATFTTAVATTGLLIYQITHNK